MNDERKELIEKMNHGVSRLSPISRKLYFSLCDEFLSRHKGDTIKTSLRQYSKYIGIKAQGIADAINQIQLAFNEIHLNTFQEFKYDFVLSAEENDASLIISRVDNMDKIKRAMEIIGNKTLDDHTYH